MEHEIKQLDDFLPHTLSLKKLSFDLGRRSFLYGRYIEAYRFFMDAKQAREHLELFTGQIDISQDPELKDIDRWIDLVLNQISAGSKQVNKQAIQLRLLIDYHISKKAFKQAKQAVQELSEIINSKKGWLSRSEQEIDLEIAFQEAEAKIDKEPFSITDIIFGSDKKGSKEIVRKAKKVGGDYFTRLTLLEATVAYYQKKWEECDEKLGLVRIELQRSKSLEQALGINFYLLEIKFAISQGDYTTAREVLQKSKQIFFLNQELQFLQLQLHIESQLVLANSLYDQYIQLREKIDVPRYILETEKLRAFDGNALLFLAYLQYFEGTTKAEIEDLIKRAKEEELKPSEEVNGPNKYPEIGTYILEGWLARREQEYFASANYIFQAGKRYSWGRNPQAANQLFEWIETNIIDKEQGADFVAIKEQYPDFRTYYWHYANSIAEAAQRPNGPPYSDLEQLNYALNIWHRESDIINPMDNPDDYWAYGVLAYIHNSRHGLVSSLADDEYWQSIIYLQRAVILNQKDDWNWIKLSEVSNFLELNSYAEYAIRKASTHLQDRNQEFSDEILIMSWLNSGRSDEEIERKLSILSAQRGHQSYLIGWQGYLLYLRWLEGYLPSIEPIIELFEESLQKNPKDTWVKSMLVNVYWTFQAFQKATNAAEAILQFEGEIGYEHDQAYFAMAYLALGQLNQAEILNHQALSRLENKYQANTSYVLIKIAQGKINSQEDNFEYILATGNKRELQVFYKELEAIVAFVEWKESPIPIENIDKEALAILQNWKAAIKKRINDLEDTPITPDEELLLRLQGRKYPKDSFAWLALQSSLAYYLAYSQNSLYSKLGAYQIYQDILPRKKDFPEVTLVLRRLEKEIIELGNQAILEKQTSGLSDFFAKYEPVVSDGMRSDWSFLLALVYYQEGHLEAAKAILATKLTSTSYIEERLQKNLQNFTHYNAEDTATFWQYIDLLKTLQRELQLINTDSWNDLLSSTLEEYGSKTLFTTPTNTVSTEIVKTNFNQQRQAVGVLSIEVNYRFESWEILSDESIKFMNAIRDHFRYYFGVNIPQGLLKKQWGSVFPDYSYTIKIKELVVDAAQIPRDVEPESYLLQRMKNVLKWHLPTFHTLYDSSIYLQRFIPDQVVEHANKILEDNQLLLSFHQLLRQLLSEQVAINDKEEIINGFMEQREASPDTLLGYVRRKLWLDLPGNRSTDEEVVSLPLRVEQTLLTHLRQEKGKVWLALDRSTFATLHKELRNFIKSLPASQQGIRLISVKSEVLRLPLRQLLEPFFPTVLVLSEAEQASINPVI